MAAAGHQLHEPGLFSAVQQTKALGLTRQKHSLRHAQFGHRLQFPVHQGHPARKRCTRVQWGGGLAKDLCLPFGSGVVSTHHCAQSRFTRTVFTHQP